MGDTLAAGEGIGAGVPNRTLVVSDNLPALAAMPDACVDLIYLDPPFNSKKEYSNPINIPEEYAYTLYRDYTEMGVKVVEPSFSDQWSMELYLKDAAGNIYPNPNWKHQWVTAIAEAYPALHSVLTSAGQAQDEGLQGYLTFMAVRLLQMRRVLRETGSIYLHCDPTASHYLKAVMDCIFGHGNFIDEIVWNYGTPSGGRAAGKKPVKAHDVLLAYAAKYGAHTYNVQYLPYSEKYINERFVYTDEAGRKYRTRKRSNGRVDRQFLDESKGVPLSNVWSDLKQLYAYHLVRRKAEDTGYPTQKPLALLDRIILASSKEGDVVLDPFCGCATACIAAEKLGRRWIGIDRGEEAYRQVVRRMQNTVKLASKDTPLLLEPERVITRMEELPGQRMDYPLVPQPEARRVGGRTTPPPRVRVEDRTKQWLFGVQQGYCIGCAASIPIYLLSIDHVVPRAAGGPDEEWNYQLLCSYCNPVKGDRLTTKELWEANLKSGVLTDIERVRRLWKAREGERRGKGFERWLRGG